MGFSKEVINQECKLVTRSDSASSFPERIDQGVNTRWNRVISQVTLVFIVELAIHAEDTSLSWSSQGSSLGLGRVLLTEKLGRVLTQTHEA